MRDQTSRRPSVACFRSAALLGLLLCCPLSGVCQLEPRYVHGQVRVMGGGPPPPDVTLRLEEAEGVVVAVRQHFVGTDGKFEFNDLHSNSYRVVVTAKKFQTAHWEVDMNYLASRFPQIYLVPVSEKKSALPGSSVPLAADLVAPKKAKKAYQKGVAAFQKGSVDEALGHFEQAMAEGPCYARAQAALGVTHTMRHELNLAEAAFRKAIKCDGGFAEPYVQLAILFDAEKRYKDSEPVLGQGLRQLPGEWQLYYQLGTAHHNLGDYERAEGEYLKAQALHPEVPPEFHPAFPL